MLWMMIGSALALDCNDYHFKGALPADGATEQPRNTKVMLSAYAWSVDDEPQLVNALTDTPVPAAVTHIDDGTLHHWLLEPNDLLDVGTDYRAEIRRGGGVVDSTSFTTGTETDVVSPEVPDILGTDSAFSTDTWGDWASFSVEIAPAGDEPVYYELTLTPGEGDALVRYSLFADARFSDDPCNSNDAGLLDADDTVVEVVAIDAAGNRSDGAGYNPPGGGSAGCAVTSAPAGLLASLLAVVSIRRRDP